jgi:hypothetical protein
MKNTITILIFLLVIPLSVSGWRASANKSSKAYYADNVLYMNPKSELIMWIDGKNGRVRIGDVFSPYSGCEEKSIMTCFIFSGTKYLSNFSC